jgi:hypothetical protein
MIPTSGGVRFWLATGHTGMPKGFDGLPLLVQETRTSASVSHSHSAAVRAAMSGS